MSFKVEPYNEHVQREWDIFVERSPMGTLLHTRNFLDYHGSRFVERSLLIKSTNGKIVALFPAASRQDSLTTVISHPGATFGGLLTIGRPDPEATKEILWVICKYYKHEGLSQLQYVSIPSHVTVQRNETDISAFQQLEAEFEHCDLWVIINLRDPGRRKKTLKGSLKKAARAGISIIDDQSPQAYKQFHSLLIDNLQRRHNTAPIHQLDEMNDLRKRLGDKCRLALALGSSNDLLAGTWLLKHQPGVWHTQYIASNEKGREMNAVHLLIDRVIADAADHNDRFISLGTSATPNKEIDTPLFHFKAGFGGEALVNWKISLTLNSL